MTVAQAFAKNSVLQIAGKMVGTVFGLATFYLMLHFFGTAGFGVFTAAMTYVTLFAIVVDFGLTLTTTQMISEHGADEAKILGNLVSLRTLTALVFMAICPLGALFIPQSAGLMNLIVVGSMTYFFAAIAQMFQGVFQKRLNIGMVVIAETLNRTIALVGIVIVGLSGGGLLGAALAFFVGIIVQLLIMLLATSAHVKFRPEFDLKMWWQICVRSWPIGVSILFNLLYLRGDIFFMWIFGISPTEIGQYGSAYKVVDVITMIPVTLMGLLLPLMTLAWSQRHYQQFQTHLQRGFDTLSIIAIPFACGSVVVGVPLMLAVQPDLRLAGQVLGVLGPAVAVLCFGSLYGHAVVAVNQQKPMMLAYAVVAALALAGYIVFIPLYGAWAAAWVTLGSEILIAGLAYLVVTRTSKAHVNFKMLGRVASASIVMTAVILTVPSPHVLVTILTGVIVYVVALSALGGPTPRAVFQLFSSNQPS